MPDPKQSDLIERQREEAARWRRGKIADEQVRGLRCPECAGPWTGIAGSTMNCQRGHTWKYDWDRSALSDPQEDPDA